MFLGIKHSKQLFFRNNYFGSQPFVKSCYFTKTFVTCLAVCYFSSMLFQQYVIPALCYFSVYKLISWNPANIYLSKVNSINTRERCKTWRKLTIKTVESHSGVVIVNLEHISHLFLVFLLWNLNG